MKRTHMRRMIQLGCLSIALVSIAPPMSAKRLSSRETSACSSETLETLRRLGAKQIDSSGTKFELERGVILTLSCSQKRLSAAQVGMTFDFGEALTRNGSPECAASAKENHCCMSELAYRRFIEIVKQLEPFGILERQDPIGLVGPAGWLRTTEEFTHANLVRLQRTAAGDEPGIAGFSVFYWLPLKGRVKQKRLETVDVGNQIGYARQFLTVDHAEVEVSDSDYQRIRKGQTVELERTIGGNLARILSIRD